MTRALEIVLKNQFDRFAAIYIDTFERSYEAYGAPDADFDKNFDLYCAVVQGNWEAICRIAAAEINTYLNLYSIHVRLSADEFKIAYYLGVAIERHLQRVGLVEVAQIHMFSMIGILDFRLRTLGYRKPQLTKAMTKLIKLGVMNAELGPTGCYLTYKCVSTSEKLPPPGVP